MVERITWGPPAQQGAIRADLSRGPAHRPVGGGIGNGSAAFPEPGDVGISGAVDGAFHDRAFCNRNHRGREISGKYSGRQQLDFDSGLGLTIESAGNADSVGDNAPPPAGPVVQEDRAIKDSVSDDLTL